MSTDTTGGEGRTESTTGEDQEWGKISLAVVISVVLALGAHYLLLANFDLHPTIHALIGIVLFFVAGLIMFKIVLF